MAPRGTRISERQRIMLLDYLEAHPELVSGRLTAEFTKAAQDKLWNQLAEILNADGLGATKDVKKWRKSWADWKSNVKSKAASIKNSARCTGGGEQSPLELSELEKRLLLIIGEMCVEGNAEVMELGFVIQNKQEPELQIAGGAGPSILNELGQDGPQSPPKAPAEEEFVEFCLEAGECFTMLRDAEVTVPKQIDQQSQSKTTPEPIGSINSGCLPQNIGNVSTQESQNCASSSLRNRKRKRNIRTEITENYDKATETLKEIEEGKNEISKEKNNILKDIKTALEERNEIERQKANSIEKIASAFVDISKHVEAFAEVGLQFLRHK